MKVLMVNGSPHKEGCTYTGLSEVAKAIKEAGIETDFYWIGNKAMQGCIGCYGCVEKRKCVFDDEVNKFTELAMEYDGFVFGSPVFYSGMNGSLKAFMDRAFYSSSTKDPHPFKWKVAGAMVSARRAGTTVTWEQLNQYLLYNQMIVPGSRYWNMVHGNTPDEVRQDIEGLQIMRVLGRNIAWVLKMKEAAEKAGITIPEQEEKINTNFIR